MKGSFEQGILAFKAKLETELTAIVLKVVFDAHGRIVLRSPVDTGRYKANNQIHLNSLPESSVIALDKSGSVTVSEGQGKMGEYTLGDTVFLYNNVAYAVAIEEGHSGQAPHGVYRLTAADMIEQLQQIAKAGV